MFKFYTGRSIRVVKKAAKWNAFHYKAGMVGKISVEAILCVAQLLQWVHQTRILALLSADGLTFLVEALKLVRAVWNGVATEGK